ncbi:fer-1-like protein 4 isoform X2 [Etheostoma spectabile]|uniref:fer-1-like protein 4 isoform X2 n=1 Tax=Etheostoma spectabile TaxID=54343 RepID=UPI0013AF81E2|nr:fer-1-like protein 4 isoform X2 [Etheostoma spectabile]
MSISGNLRKICNLPGRSNRKVELCFRGFTHKTRVLQCENLAIFNEELPEQAYLHPPLTLFVVEHRVFGRLALVGTHVVQSLMNYTPRKLGGEEEEEDDEPKPKLRQNMKKINPLVSLERIGLSGLSIKQSKIPFNPINLVNDPLKKLRNKGEGLEEQPPELEELDWWSKYYASLEEMERRAAEEEEAMKEKQAEMAG